MAELADMKGLFLSAVDSSRAPHQWIFRFGDPCFANIESVWRIVREGRVVLAARDHEQVFGRSEPVDAAKEADALLRGHRLLSATIKDDTGDLVIEFEGGIRLETFTDSSG